MTIPKHIKIRTVFMGTSSFAATMLEGLINEHYNLVGIYTKPDKPVGRDRKIQASPVKDLALKNELPVYQPQKFTDEITDELKKLKPDLIIVAAYGKILPKSVLNVPGFACINVHTSLLPKFRGPSPVQNALLCGEENTGVTIMLMNEGMDTGDILAQQSMAIEPHDTYPVLLDKLAFLAKDLLLKTVPLWIERKIEPVAQTNENATLCQMIDREDGRIYWDEDAQVIYNKYRALYPWPGVFTFWKQGDRMIRIKLLSIGIQKTDPLEKHAAGQVFAIGEKIGIQAASGVILLEELQFEGKKPMNITDVINGYQSFVGSTLI